MSALADVLLARRMEHKLTEKDAITAHRPDHNTAKTSMHVFEAVRVVKILMQLVAFLPTVGQNRHMSRAFMNWPSRLQTSHIESTMSRAADKRLAGCRHSCLPTLGQHESTLSRAADNRFAGCRH